MTIERRLLTRGEWVVLAVLYGIPLLGNIHVLSAMFCSLWNVPAGTSLRPMGLACLTALIAVATAAIGCPVSLVVLFRRRRAPLFVMSALLCLALSLAPWFVGRWAMEFIGNRHGLNYLK